MVESKEYPGFFVVNAKYKVGDIVDWSGSLYTNDSKPITCVITEVCILADHDDNYEASYTVCGLANGILCGNSLTNCYPYESELCLNKEITRDIKIVNLLDYE